MNHELWREKTLSQVWPEFIAEKGQVFGDQSYYKEYFRALVPFFSRIMLKDIYIGHIVDYRNARLRTAGPGLINFEIYALQQILNKAGVWAQIDQFYKPLTIPNGRYRQVLLPEEALHRRMWRTHLRITPVRHLPAPVVLEDPLEILWQANRKGE